MKIKGVFCTRHSEMFVEHLSGTEWTFGTCGQWKTVLICLKLPGLGWYRLVVHLTLYVRENNHLGHVSVYICTLENLLFQDETNYSYLASHTGKLGVLATVMSTVYNMRTWLFCSTKGSFGRLGFSAINKHLEERRRKSDRNTRWERKR